MRGIVFPSYLTYTLPEEPSLKEVNVMALDKLREPKPRQGRGVRMDESRNQSEEMAEVFRA